MNKHWPTKKLGEVLEKIVGGGTPAKDITPYWNGDIPWASVKDIKEGIFVLNSTKDYITEAGMKSSAANLIPKGTVVISTRMGLGRVVKTEIDVAINQDLKALFPKKNLDTDYLLLFLRSKAQEMVAKGSGATVSGIRLEHIRGIEIPLPPLAEQKKIVAKLDGLLAKIKEAKRLRAEAQEAAQNLLSAELYKIFEEGKKKGWKEDELGEICELNPKKSELKNKPDDFLVSFVPMSAVDEYAQEIVFWTERRLSEVKKGYTYFCDRDVLFAKITPCMENGKVAVAEKLKNGIGFGTTEFHILRAKEHVLPEWIYYIIRQPFFRDAAKQRMTGSAGQKRVPIQFLEKYKIPLPPITEQKKIVPRLDSLSEKIKTLQEYQKLTHVDFIKLEQSILTKAFNGDLHEFSATVMARTHKDWFAIKQGIAAVLEGLAKTSYERGEMVIAKYMFFLQEVFKIPFGLNFARHQFGPYDPDIKRAIRASAFNKDKFFRIKGSGDRQVYSLGENANRILEGKYGNSNILINTQNALSRLMPHTAKAGSSAIERLATVCKIVQDIQNTEIDQVMLEMESWKKDKFTREQVKKSLEFISFQGWDKILIKHELVD